MFNQHIDMKLPYNTFIEVHSESSFALNSKPLFSQGHGKRSLIHFLWKPRTQGVMHLEAASDDLPGNLIGLSLRI